MIALFAVVALTAGVFVTAIVAVVGVAIYFCRRLLHPAPKRPAVTVAEPRATPGAASGDVIDVTATEVR